MGVFRAPDYCCRVFGSGGGAVMGAIGRKTREHFADIMLDSFVNMWGNFFGDDCLCLLIDGKGQAHCMTNIDKPSAAVMRKLAGQILDMADEWEESGQAYE